MSEPGAKPSLEITPERVICSLHGEPFREQWPKGYSEMVVAAIDHVLDSDGFRGDAKNLCAEGVEKPGVREMTAALDLLPVCCRLTSDQLLKAYKAAKIGRTKRCKLCGKKREGTHFRTTTVEFRHVCFICVVGRLGTPVH